MSDEGLRVPPDDLLLPAVEAVVFVSEEPVAAEDIAAGLGGIEVERIEAALEELAARYRREECGLSIERVAGGYRLATRADVGTWVRQFFRSRHRTRLTASTLEVLAIVAYRQPVTAPEIQSVRGRDPAYALRVLLEKKMIRILGRKKVVGSPLLYGTTKQFLLHFGLDSLGDLPSIEEFETFMATVEDSQGSLLDGVDDDIEPERAAETAATEERAPSDETTIEEGDRRDEAVDTRADDGSPDEPR